MAIEPSVDFTPTTSPYGKTEPSMLVNATFSTAKLTVTTKQLTEKSLKQTEPQFNK